MIQTQKVYEMAVIIINEKFKIEMKFNVRKIQNLKNNLYKIV